MGIPCFLCLSWLQQQKTYIISVYGLSSLPEVGSFVPNAVWSQQRLPMDDAVTLALPVAEEENRDGLVPLCAVTKAGKSSSARSVAFVYTYNGPLEDPQSSGDDCGNRTECGFAPDSPGEGCSADSGDVEYPHLEARRREYERYLQTRRIFILSLFVSRGG